MANWSLPTLSSLYTAVISALSDRLDDAAKWFDSGSTSPTNLPTGTKRWNATSSKFEKWSGSAWSDLATTYAIDISGNAATATTATTVSDNAISSAKIASSAVTTPKIADGGVTTAKIADASVGVSKLASGFTLPVARGGTGATSASGARANLGAQDALVSGTNIKTINSTSLLGSGNISITSGVPLDCGVNNVGSINVLAYIGNISISAGSLSPGSLLLTVNANFYTDAQFGRFCEFSFGGTCSGTWRMLGMVHATQITFDTAYVIAVWQRIS